MSNLNVGKTGEDLASDFIKKKGYKILDRNFRIKGGEIDIVAVDGKEIVYIEVKTRTSHKFGLPEEAVTASKQRFLERAAKIYRNNHKNLPQRERIDVIAIDLEGSNHQLRHIKNITL